jgi:C4-dicarboxylate-specific signal transduction histidine kinase
VNNRTIYIADDDKNLLELYSSIFISEEDDDLDFFDDGESENNFSVQMFEDGFFLIDAFEKAYAGGERIPVAILDMRMPKMSGFETAKKIKDIDKNCIIVVITAYSDVSMSEIRQQLENDIYYFKKPFNEEELYSLVDSVLKQWNDREENITLQRHLEEINRDLEAKVNEELEKSRKKDAVISKQQRLAYIGELLSNIAHHWRQPLNQLALMVQDLDDAYKNDELDDIYCDSNIGEILEIVNYMSKTIDNFRDFFAPNEMETVFPLSKVVKDSVDIYEYQIKSGEIEINFSIDETVQVKGFPNELSRTIVSLLSNSKEAFDKRKIEAPRVNISVESDGENAILFLDDNGGGVEKDLEEKVFEPYITSKPPTEGNGLGLFFCKMVVENQMGGKISLNNHQAGVRVTISLPQV